MLCPGIKIGLKDWKEKLDGSGASYAEVWYRVDQAAWYRNLFKGLQERKTQFGLHFWAVTSTGHEPNLGYPGSNFLESKELIKRCIDDAAAAGAQYVNIHSGNRCMCTIDFDQHAILFDGHFPVISEESSASCRNEAVDELSHYAKSNGTFLLVESIPAKSASGDARKQMARCTPIDVYPTSIEHLFDRMQQGALGYTNDFCHLFSMGHDVPRAKLWESFLKTTESLAPFTHVLHVNTLTPPYNGTDQHCGILPHEIEAEGAFPDAQELKFLLSLFKAQKQDVWIIGEPQDRHIENYLRACELIKEA